MEDDMEMTDKDVENIPTEQLKMLMSYTDGDLYKRLARELYMRKKEGKI